MTTFRTFMELSQKIAKDLHQWRKKEGQLSFENIFGNKVRIVVPYASNRWNEIKEKIEGLKDKKTGKPKGYAVDLARGMVVQSGTTLIGEPFKRELKLGKVIEQELDQDLKNYYNKVGNPTQESLQNDYSIVVSRHPIDIARMSDHSGIESCHSPDDSYFPCALAEAKGHGPVAYLVKNSDLQTVSDLQADEIFKDSDRGIEGIVPVARIRLRRFTNKKKDYDLAIPETRVYGEDAGDIKSNFKDSLLAWSQKAQANLINDRPSMSEFTRKGGNYTDTASGTLFNKFFNDDKDSGDADYEGKGGDNLADQYDNEIEQLRQGAHFANQIHHYASVEGEDNEPYVSCDGSVQWIFNDGDFWWGKWEIDSDTHTKVGEITRRHNVQYEWKKAITKAAEGAIHEYGVQNVEIEKDHSNPDAIVVRFDIHADSDNNGPDSYRDLLVLLADWDKGYEIAGAAIRKKLTELNLMSISDTDKHLQKWTANMFNNFTWEEENNIIVVHSHPFVIGNTRDWHKLPGVSYNYNRQHDLIDKNSKGIDEIKKGIELFVTNLVSKARAGERQQWLLPGFKHGFLPTPKWPLGRMDIVISTNNNILTASLNFRLNGLDKKGLINTEYYIKFLDKNFPQILMTARHMFDTKFKPYYNQKI